MKTLKALTTSEVDEPTQEVFSAIKNKVGMLPNLYAAMGNSPQLLKGFLTFEEALKQGDFSAKENEIIALAVSQSNGCDYCLAAHSAIAKMSGLTEGEVIDIRLLKSDNRKTNALANLAFDLTENRGKASQNSIDEFLHVGYSKKALAELIGVVAIRSITNYLYSNGDFEIDFPVAADLELATA